MAFILQKHKKLTRKNNNSSQTVRSVTEYGTFSIQRIVEKVFTEYPERWRWHIKGGKRFSGGIVEK